MIGIDESTLSRLCFHGAWVVPVGLVLLMWAWAARLVKLVPRGDTLPFGVRESAMRKTVYMLIVWCSVLYVVGTGVLDEFMVSEGTTAMGDIRIVFTLLVLFAAVAHGAMDEIDDTITLKSHEHSVSGVLSRSDIPSYAHLPCAPTCIIFVPDATASTTFDYEHIARMRWLWDAPTTEKKTPLDVRVITPERADLLPWNTAAPQHVMRIMRAIQYDMSNMDKILLVGEGQGASTVLKALGMLRHSNIKIGGDIVGVVCLMGPLDTMQNGLVHRFGNTLCAHIPHVLHSALGLTRILHVVPEQDRNMGKDVPMLFVTSDGDARVPKASVESFAKDYDGELMVLGPNVPHDVMDAWGVDHIIAIRRKLYNTLKQRKGQGTTHS